MSTPENQDSEWMLQVIVERAGRIMGSCNGSYTNHQQGILRGLVWALTGDDPGVIQTTEELSVLIGREVLETKTGLELGNKLSSIKTSLP